MVTTRQIAQQCGVSISTVSKALNGAGDVSRATAERIRQAAEELGYMPNPAARALKTRRSYCFGILFAAAAEQGLTQEFFSRILNSFKNRSGELGYDITFIGDRLGKRRIGYAEHALYRNCDGVLLVTGSDEEGDLADELERAGIPLVCVDHIQPGCGSVLSDNRKGMGDLTRYALTMGHRRIALIHGEESFVTRTRIDSFLDECARGGVHITGEYLREAAYHDPESARAATAALLALPQPPTCIFYPDDFAFIGGMNELESRGLRLPADISAAGYDGISICQAFHPRLTTIRQDAEAMGARAAEELAAAIEEGESYIPRQLLIPGELLRGETVRHL